MPNTFAYIVLFSWPLIVFLLFRKLPVASALVWSIVGGYLLLPTKTGFDFPLLPVIDKALIPALSAAVMCLLVARSQPLAMRRGGTAPPLSKSAATLTQGLPARAAYTRQREVRQRAGLEPRSAQPVATQARKTVWIGQALLLLLVMTPFITVLQNGDVVRAGRRVIAGLQLYDSFSMVLNSLVTVLPFLLGRRYLATPEQHATLLRILCVAGLLYTLPALWEIRMSPQLNAWIYGFFPHSFAQHMRADGFRPVVFLHHGLWLGIFFAMAGLAALALWRHNRVLGVPSRYVLAAIWLGGVLFLSKNLGALAIALALGPIILLAGVRVQMIFAAVVAGMILTYPMLRGAGLIPTDTIHAIASSISEERADSLKYRLDNEDILLAHANTKPVAGWGGWGRSRVYDPRSGEDISTTDGIWIIIIGVSGWLGYIAQFGLLTIPLMLLALRRRGSDVSLVTSGLCLVLSVNLLDMVPNATLTPITWLIAGALMGRCGMVVIEGSVEAGREARPHRPSLVSRS